MKKKINELAQIVAFNINQDENECLVVVEHKNITETYLGNYTKLTTYDVNNTDILHFGQSLILMDNSPQTIEVEELVEILGKLIENDFIFQLKDNQYPRTVGKAKDMFKNKKFVGMKASLLPSMDMCQIDIEIDDKSFTFKGRVRYMPFVDSKGLFCIKISEKDEFLSHLLDDRLVDLTTILSYRDSLSCVKWICRVLVIDEGWDGKNAMELLNIK